MFVVVRGPPAGSTPTSLIGELPCASVSSSIRSRSFVPAMLFALVWERSPKLSQLAGSAIESAGFSTVGLLGTRFTMEQAFYRDRLRERHGLEVLVPDAEDRDLVHWVIYEELCLGRIVADSRTAYRRVIANLASRGAQAIILGCTEISLLVDQKDSAVPLFDTTSIHARKAAEWALLP